MLKCMSCSESFAVHVSEQQRVRYERERAREVLQALASDEPATELNDASRVTLNAVQVPVRTREAATQGIHSQLES